MQYGFYHISGLRPISRAHRLPCARSTSDESLKRHALPLLVFDMLFSFLWVTIEKFRYPKWFDPFLDNNECLPMGLPRDFFLMSAAFMGFTLAYVLLTRRNIVVLGYWP